MRHKMSCCRVSLVIGAVLYMLLNMLFLWFSVPGPVPPCDCRCDTLRGTLPDNSNVQSHNFSSLVVTNSSNFSFDANTASHVTTTVTTGSPALQAEELWEPHHLAVVVPFRNRYEEMMEFVPHIHQFLTRQRVRHQIWVINQADKHRCGFNNNNSNNYTIIIVVH